MKRGEEIIHAKARVIMDTSEGGIKLNKKHLMIDNLHKIEKVR